MITYKIRSIDDQEYLDLNRNDVVLYPDNKLYINHWDENTVSRYTIEREISDDVIDKIWEDMPWNMNYWEKDELKKSIKKHLNQ